VSTLRSHNRFHKKNLGGFSNRPWLKVEGFSEPMFVIFSLEIWFLDLATSPHADRRSRPRFSDKRYKDQAHDTGQPGTSLLAGVHSEAVHDALRSPDNDPFTPCRPTGRGCRPASERFHAMGNMVDPLR